MPEISVVIPTFRRPGPLRECIASVLAQDVAVDVLVVDDSPEGSAAQVAASFADARVAYVKMPKPTGGCPAAVRNFGYPHTSAPLIHFLDDDDRVPEGAYRTVLAEAARNPDRGVIVGRVEPFGEPGPALDHERAYFDDAARRLRRAHQLRSARWAAVNMLFRDTVLVNSACFVRRSCVAALDGYRTDLEVVEDVEFYLRAIRRFDFVFIDRPTVHYRVGNESLMHNARMQERTLRSYEKLYESYRSTFGAVELRALQVLARTALRWL